MKKTIFSVLIGFILGNLFLLGVIFVWHHHFRQPAAEPVTLDQAISLISNKEVDEIRIHNNEILLARSDGKINPNLKYWRCKLEYNDEVKKVVEAASATHITIKFEPQSD